VHVNPTVKIRPPIYKNFIEKNHMNPQQNMTKEPHDEQMSEQYDTHEELNHMFHVLVIHKPKII